jgi:uncharacterized protein
MTQRKGSRYNIAVPADDDTDVLLFNSATRSLVRVDAETFAPARGLFHDGRRGLARDLAAPVPADLDADLAEALEDGGFLVPAELDEVGVLRAAFERSRDSRDLAFTIGMTMACNFACPYCFEEHRPEHMTRETAEAVVAFVAQKIAAAGARSVHVNWFGGEPLLNLDVMCELSDRLRAEAARAGAAYASMAITNGALLTRPVAERMSAAGIGLVQVTLDGPRDIHDARRPFKGGQPSFDRIVGNLREVGAAIRVIVRVNVDQDNHPRIGELVRALDEAGVLAAGGIERIYAGKLTTYTEQVQMVGETIIQHDLPSLDAPIRAELGALGLPVPAERVVLAGEANRGGCSAMNHHSFVVGPRGHLFKCELGIHDVREAIGSVAGSEADESVARAPAVKRGRKLPVVGAAVGSKAHDWTAYNPFDNAKCSGCQFAPICKGGCPKRVLEQDTAFMQETCDYWDHNIARFVRHLQESRSDDGLF